jgi:hypothetical protein
MRYAIFGALILSLRLVGVSVAAAAVPANGSLIAKTNFDPGWRRLREKALV